MKAIKNYLVLALALGIWMQSNGQTRPESAVPIKMENVPVTTVVETLARLSETNCIFEPKLFENADGSFTEPTLTFYWTDLSYRQALVRVLKEHHLAMILLPGAPVGLIAWTNQIVNQVDASLLGDDSSTNTDQPIVFQDAPLDDSLRALVRIAKVEVTLDPKLSGYIDARGKMIATPTVSVRWEKVTCKQAIIALCETYNLIIVKDPANGEIRIAPRP